MGATPQASINDLTSALKKLRQRMTCANRHGLLPERALSALMDADMLSVCRRAKEMGLSSWSWNSCLTVPVTYENPLTPKHGWPNAVTFEFDERYSPVPKKADRILDPEVNQAVKEWIVREVDLRIRFGKAELVLMKVCHACTTWLQARYFMPNMLTLLSEVDGKVRTKDANAKKISALRDYRVPQRLPHLPDHYIKECKDADGIIAAAKLLPTDLKQEDVVLTFGGGLRVETPVGDVAF